MNIDRLHELIRLVLNPEASTGVSARLEQLVGAWNTVVANPQQPRLKIDAGQPYEDFKVAADALFAIMSTPDGLEAADTLDLRAETLDLGREVRLVVQIGEATPAAASFRLKEIYEARNTRLVRLAVTEHVLRPMVTVDYAGLLQPNKGRITFTVPRLYFGNTLAGLQSKLAELEGVLLVASELATGSRESPTLGSISTSDPTFDFQLDPESIKATLEFFKAGLQVLRDFKELKSGLASALSLFTPDQSAAAKQKLAEQQHEALARKADSIVVTYKERHEDGRFRELTTEVTQKLGTVVIELEGAVTIRISGPAPDAPPEIAAKITEVAVEAQSLQFPTTIDVGHQIGSSAGE